MTDDRTETVIRILTQLGDANGYTAAQLLIRYLDAELPANLDFQVARLMNGLTVAEVRRAMGTPEDDLYND